LEDENIIFIIRLLLINIALQINILFLYFENIHLALYDVFSNYFFTIYLILILITFFLFIEIFKKNKIKFFINDNTLCKINFLPIILCFITCIFLISLMHTVAKTGVSFWGYNNRALLSLSVILPISISLIYTNSRFKKALKLLIIFFIILKFIFLYAFQLNQIAYSKKIMTKAIEISKLFLDRYKNYYDVSINKETLIIFYSKDNFSNLKLFDRATFINDSFDFRYLMSDLSDNFFISDLQLKNNINFFKKPLDPTLPKGKYNDSGFHYVKGYHLNDFKYCNKNSWDDFFREYIKRDFERDVYLIFDKLNEKVTSQNLIKISNYEHLIDILETTSNCSTWYISKKNDVDKYKNLATELSGKSNQRKLFLYDSFFLRYLILLYNSYFKNII